jgi:hypothetical protein
MTTASPPPISLVMAGISCVAAGFGATQPVALAVGCGLLAAAGNLSVTPVLLPRNSSRPATPVVPKPGVRPALRRPLRVAAASRCP